MSLVEAERRLFEEVAARLRTAGAVATALGCGLRDNHGDPLGRETDALVLLRRELGDACLLLHHAGLLPVAPGAVLVPIDLPPMGKAEGGMQNAEAGQPLSPALSPPPRKGEGGKAAA
jgi:hypothetical protein